MGEATGEELALVRALAAGREEAFARLYDRFGPRLFRVARAVLGSREEAEDAVQELFVNLVRSRRSLAGVRNLAAYLFASLRRVAARRGQRAHAAREAVEEAPRRAASGESEIPVARRERLARALAALPAGQREVLALKIDGGLTFAQVAAALETSPNTAASRYRYALEKLRASMEEC